jgi:hypothetical protein
MRAPVRIIGLILVTGIGATGCGSTSASMPPSVAPASMAPTAVSTPTAPATPAPATPEPSANPDIDGYVEAVLAILQDPQLAAEFELFGSTTISGAEFELTGSLVVEGSDMGVVSLLQPYDIQSGQISSGGKVYLHDGEGHWIRDDQAPAAMPAFADAFAGSVTAGPWVAGSGADEAAFQVKLAGVALDTLLAATGMVDPGMTGATGDVTLLLSTTGELQAIVIEARGAASQGLEPSDMVRAMAVKELARIGAEGAPSIAAPDDIWLRYYSEDLGYLIEFPPEMKRTTANGADHYNAKAPHDFSVNATLMEDGASLDSVVAKEIKRVKAAGAKVTDDATIELDGVPARRISLTAKSDGKAYWIVKVMTVHEDVLYYLTWIDLAARKKAGQPVLNEMVGNFRSSF